MEMVDIRLPKSLVISTIIAELSSFALNKVGKVLIYIKGFDDTDGQIHTNIETFPIDESDTIMRFFDMNTNMGVFAIDTRLLVDDPANISNSQLKKFASILEELHSFMQRSVVKKNDSIPIFNNEESNEEKEETPTFKNMANAYRKMHEVKNEEK